MKQFPFTWQEILGAFTVGVFFVLAAHLSTTYIDQISGYITDHSAWGPVIYILCATFAIVVAPVSATPLIPIASSMWGPLLAALYSILSWTVGAVIAFWLARTYGFSRVGKIVSLKKVQEYARHIPRRNLFLSVVLLRLILPVDVLSYALGLFSEMKLWRYTLATLIGITPFAFVFSYAVHFPFWLQIVTLLLTGIVVTFGYYKVRKQILHNSSDAT